MSWQQLSPISLEQDYLVPRSLLHLGPLIKQVLFGPGYLTWPTPSSLASNVRTFASFGKITRTVEPFSTLIGRFVVLPLIGNISRTAGPFLNMWSFLDSPRRPLAADTKVYGFLIPGSCSRARFGSTDPTITTSGISYEPRPAEGPSRIKAPHQR